MPTYARECRFVRVTGVLNVAIWDARTCVALVLTSQNRLPSTWAPPAQAPPSPAAYDAQPQHPPPWPTRLPEPGKRASHTVTSGIVGSDPDRTDRRIGMPTEAIGICEPMLTEHPFGLGVAWRMAGRPVGAFYPFLSGRDNLRAVARRWGLGDHRVEVVLGQAGLAERRGRRGRLQLRHAATAGRGRGGRSPARFTLSCLRAKTGPVQVA